MSGIPFVLTVASEKGGVGKTTLATNLAVYLKALREDLPVTVVSFDNHFSVDNMFAIGAHRATSVAGLFDGTPLSQLLQLGEYGVQYFASARALTPPNDDPHHLSQVLHRSALGGIFIIDTRPIIDYFTRSALLAADLILAPVKDRPSLVNAASILTAIEEDQGDAAKLWLVPSLIDSRLKLRADIGIREFLVFSARERGFQVLESYISKSPKVESLATNLTTRVYPILTHARNTIVHSQYREIAEFVLAQYDRFRPQPPQETLLSSGLPEVRLQRLTSECAICGEPIGSGERVLCQDFRSRGKGLLHRDCLEALLAETELGVDLPAEGMLVFDLSEAGVSSSGDEVAIHLFAADGEEQFAARISLTEVAGLELFLRTACRRGADEFFRDALLVALESDPYAQLHGAGLRRYALLRHRVLRELFALV